MRHAHIPPGSVARYKEQSMGHAPGRNLFANAESRLSDAFKQGASQAVPCC